MSENYGVTEAYYFLGYLDEKNDERYKEVQRAGFIIVFKEHNAKAKSKKKGNIDTDLVFEIMKNVADSLFDKVVLVSGDGDYKKVVYYLVEKGRFKKIFFPNKKYASSLYNSLGSEYFVQLEDLKSYIDKKEVSKKEKGS